MIRNVITLWILPSAFKVKAECVDVKIFAIITNKGGKLTSGCVVLHQSVAYAVTLFS